MKKGNEIPTIDVVLVTVTAEGGTEIGLTTANKISIAPQTETEDAVRLVVKGVLIAQKPRMITITGHEITLTDNVFNPELAVIFQGGTIVYDTDTEKVVSYTPPKTGSGEKGEPFKLNAYTAIYNAAGIITGYERCAYPNCQGEPFANNMEDGTFRQSEYTITSAPSEDQSPYEITYVSELPVVS